MAHFAKVENNIVTRVITAEQDFINSGILGDPSLWIQTSYNTRNGIHYEPNSETPSEDQSKALRKNFAGVGFTYDAELDAFIPPKDHASWILDTQTGTWKPPVEKPALPESHEYKDYIYYEWNEETVSWVLGRPFNANSWTLDENGYYIPPSPKPEGVTVIVTPEGNIISSHRWNEETMSWEEAN